MEWVINEENELERLTNLALFNALSSQLQRFRDLFFHFFLLHPAFILLLLLLFFPFGVVGQYQRSGWCMKNCSNTQEKPTTPCHAVAKLRFGVYEHSLLYEPCQCFDEFSQILNI